MSVETAEDSCMRLHQRALQQSPSVSSIEVWICRRGFSDDSRRVSYTLGQALGVGFPVSFCPVWHTILLPNCTPTKICGRIKSIAKSIDKSPKITASVSATIQR